MRPQQPLQLFALWSRRLPLLSLRPPLWLAQPRLFLRLQGAQLQLRLLPHRRRGPLRYRPGRCLETLQWHPRLP